MKTLKHLPLRTSRHKQRGIATILVVALVGVALTAASVGIMHTVRSTQEKQVSVHASTHAQAGVWSGVEAMRRYLGMIDNDTLLALPDSLEIGLSEDNHYGRITANDISITEIAEGIYHVSANIVNVHDAAKASSAVGVVFEVSDACEDCVELSAALDFHDDLDVGGQITLTMPEGVQPVINVDGDISILNVGMSELGQLSATGSISLGSEATVDIIYSNDDVILSGKATASAVYAGGRVKTSGAAGADEIKANKAVTIDGGHRSETVESLETITISKAGHGYLNAKGDIIVDNSVERTLTKSDVVVTRAAAKIDQIVAEGTLRCPTPGWSRFDSLSINGDLGSDCAQAANQIDKVTVGANNTVTVMTKLQPFSIPKTVVDVWVLKDKANYVFEYDEDKGRTKVTVQNINGQVDDVDYYIGDYPGKHKSYLCTEFNAAGKCIAPAEPHLTVCLGHSTNNDCISYDVATETWELDGTSAAPGIMWFKGSVILDNGRNYTTILATGNVKTGGQFRGVSVNYAGYDEICLATGRQIGMQTEYRKRFGHQYPTNLCDKEEGEYLPIPTGNIAIAAGGYNPEKGGEYSGGNIELATNNEVYGAVLAGGTLKTGGSTKVYGHVLAAVQGERGLEENKLGGNTTIDLSDTPDTYDPSIIPDMAPPCITGCEPEDFSERSKLLWSRYL